VAAGKRENYAGRRKYWDLQQNAAKLSQVVQDMRRSHFTEHPGLGLTDVYAAVIPDVPFIPGLHVNYSETKLPIRDGLLKLKDFPHGFGGSGIEVAE
jgi:hypothetical protein